MQDFSHRINDFFDRYAARFRDALSGGQPDVQGTANAFASSFIEASPAGIRCAANDAGFAAAIPQGYDFYRKIGTIKMEIGSREITLLDDLHAMVKIHWLSSYLKKDGARIDIGFDVFYIVQSREENIKIFCYITGDEQKALSDYGLLPQV
jgi:hypothetical protein